jgi:hypothetical protein
MKLTDFINDNGLNELRRQMRAEIAPYVPPERRATLTPEEVEALATKGIEIPLRDVDLLNDGTFTYKGRRVVVYIRDLPSYRDDYSMPRFHLAMCDTLLSMREEGRYEKRYVVATREDGLFRIQKVDGTRILAATDEKLDICQNCLHGLNYKGFNKNRKHQEKRGFIESFSINSFFEEFGRSTVWATPDYDSTHAPTNIYSVDFYRIAKEIKEQRGYRCENCGLTPERQFLHVHHVNGQKSDNSNRNLRVLCMGCHANAPRHGHMKATPGFKEFQRKYDPNH